MAKSSLCFFALRSIAEAQAIHHTIAVRLLTCRPAAPAAMDKTRHRSEARFDEQQRKRMTTGIPVEDWIAHHARFAPRSEAAHDLASGRRFTYAQFDDRISRAALWLSHTFGVGQGDRV